MKRILLAAAAALTCVAASAQTANFEGFSAALNLDLLGASVKVDNEDGLGKSSASASVQAAYGFALSKDAVISVGGTYALSSPKIFETVGGSIKLKNMASLYVEPGYLLSDKTMVYGKLSYESAKVDVSDFGSENFHGTGLGVGLRSMLNKNLFLQVEAKKISYETKDGFKPSATVGTVGIGYKF